MMRRFVIDFVRRWQALYICFVLATGLFLVSFAFTSNSGMFFPSAVFLGPFLVALDIGRGTAKIAYTLPLSRRQIGLAYWILGVPLPIAVITAMRVAIAVPVALLKPGMSMDWTFLVVLDALFAGTLYCLLTFMPSGPSDVLWRKITGAICGAVWGFAFCGPLLIGQRISHQWQNLGYGGGLMVLIGIAATIVSYLRSTQLIVDRASFKLGQDHGASVSPARATGVQISRRRLTGFPLLIGTCFVQNIAAAVILFGFVAVFDWMMGRHYAGRTGSVSQILNSMLSQWWPWLMLMAVLGSLRWITSIRTFRVMPISVYRLNCWLLLMAIAAVCGIWSLPAVTYFTFLGTWPELLRLDSFILPVGVCALMGALCLRFGHRLILITFFVALPLGLFGGEWLGNPDRWLVRTVTGVGLIIFAALLNHLSLARCGSIYQPRRFSGGFLWGGAAQN